MNKTIPSSFPITIFETNGALSDTISKGRVKIFYKGLNRNGSFITDEFAEQLIETLPYAPIKGIYNSEEEDFEDHGKSRTEGKIYGIIPQDMNFAWELHEDKDNVVREYACADVLLYTAIYEEAKQIVGSAQSMELYEPSIEGDWINVGDHTAYAFTKGAFLGLQVLGKDIEPCFEGSAFYTSLFTTLNTMVQDLQFHLTQFNKTGGKSKMDQKDQNKIVFELSTKQKENAVSKLLNANDWKYYVLDSYSDFAIVVDMDSDEIYRVDFSTDEAETLTLSEEPMKKVSVAYLTEDEKKNLEMYREAQGEIEYTNKEEFAKLKTDFEAQELKIQESEDTISTLNTEKEIALSALSEANEKNAALELELASLKEYKLEQENLAKEVLYTKYSAKLDAATIESIKTVATDFTIGQLEKELAFALVQSDDSVFTGKSSQYVPKDETKTGIEAILDNYKNK